MNIWHRNDVLFFYIPMELEELEQAVQLLRSGYNQCARQERYEKGWMLVIVQPPGAKKEQCIFQHKVEGVELELKPTDSGWTLIINNLHVYSKDPAELSPQFAYRLVTTTYKPPFRKDHIDTEFVVYEPRNQTNGSQVENDIHSNMQKDAGVMRARILSLEREKKSLETANKTLQEKARKALNEANETCKTLEEKCKTLEEKCKTLEEKCGHLNVKCNHLNDKCISLSKKGKSGKKKHSLVVAEKSGLQRENKRLENELRKLTTEAERLNEEVCFLKSDRTTVTMEMERLSLKEEERTKEMSSLEQKLKSTIEQLEAEKEKTILTETISKNLKIKEKENNILREVYQKTKESGKKAEAALKHTQNAAKKAEDALENNTIMAIIPMLYWEVAKNVLGDVLECEQMSKMGNMVAKHILTSCDVYAEDGITFSEDVVFQIRLYGFYLARSHLRSDIEKSRSFYKQFSCHLEQFNFVVPEKPVKPSGRGKKKENVTVKRYIVKGDLPDHFTTTSLRLMVVDQFTLTDAQEFLNKQAGLPPLIPMVWFIGKFKGKIFEVVVQLEPNRKLLEVKHELKAGEEIYYSSLFMVEEEE